jgi:hypothetical protein
MSFIFEMDLVEGAAEDVSEDEASFCFSSDKSNNSEGPDSSSDESSLSDNKDEGFKRRALIALIAYKIIKKKKGTKKKRKRSKNRRRTRRKSSTLLQEGMDDGLFRREYRMSPRSFHKLVNLLRADLLPKNIARTRPDYIDPEAKVMFTIRWLAGGQYVDQCRIHGISKQTFFKCVVQTINAINKNEHIGCPKWPESIAECDIIANEWARRSGPSGEKGLLATVIGMLDGLLVSTKRPTRKETKKVTDFFSGHKKQNGLNCQALCDANLRFLFVSVMCPGKTHDLKAYRKSILSKLIENLPEGYYCIGDNAYCNSEHLLVPHPGKNLTERQDSYNFYISQLRVRIENAFALLVGRWGILWRPLRVPLRRQPNLIKCLCKLHNFCIDEKESPPFVTGPGGSSATPLAETRIEEEFQTRVLKNRAEWTTNYQFQRAVEGPSLRDTIADLIQDKGCVRPPLLNRSGYS